MMDRNQKYRISSCAYRQRIACYVLAGLLAAGCTRDDDGTDNNDLSVPIEVSAVNVANTAQASTRTAGFTPLTTDGAQIAVFNTTNSGIYTYSAATQKWTSAAPTSIKRNQPGVFAAYPSDLISNKTNYGLKAQPYAANQDVLASKAQNMDYLKPVVTFEMEHIYARLTIQVVYKINLMPDYPLKEVKCTGLYTQSTLNMWTGAYSSPQTQAITVPATGRVGYHEPTQVMDYLLPPGISDNLKIEISPTEATLATQTITIPKEQYTPKAGEWVTITVEIKPLTIGLGTVQTEAWPTPDVTMEELPTPSSL